MKLALLGGAGRLGSRVLHAALQRGHTVRTLVRDPSRSPRPEAGLELVVGDALDRARVLELCGGCDAAACCLGPTTPLARAPIVGEATRVLLDAMQTLGVRRVVAVSALGIGDSRDQLPALLRAAMLLAGPYVRDKQEQERRLRESDAEWVVVRPGRIVAGPVTGRARVGTTLPYASVNADDVADCIVSELETMQHRGAAISIVHG